MWLDDTDAPTTSRDGLAVAYRDIWDSEPIKRISISYRNETFFFFQSRIYFFPRCSINPNPLRERDETYAFKNCQFLQQPCVLRAQNLETE